MEVFLGALLITHAQHSLQAVYPLEHCFKHQDFLLITHQVDMRDTITTNTKEKSHITQLDSPICEANEGELCDQFKCCGEVLDSYT